MSLACLHSDRLERTTRQIVREYWWTSQRVSVDILRSVSRSPSVSPRPAPALLFLLLLRRASSLALHSLSQTSFSLSLHLSPLPVLSSSPSPAPFSLNPARTAFPRLRLNPHPVPFRCSSYPEPRSTPAVKMPCHHKGFAVPSCNHHRPTQIRYPRTSASSPSSSSSCLSWSRDLARVVSHCPGLVLY